MIMFAFDRSALAVLAPLALLVGVVLWSNSGDVPAEKGDLAQQVDDDPSPAEAATQTVAANLPSR
jgi:hypothetical protein